MRTEKSCLLILALVFFCTSCGGGGGGDEGGNAGAVNNNQALPLNGSNALPVSGLVVDAVAGGFSAGSLGNVVITSADLPRGSGSEFNILRTAQDAWDRLWALNIQRLLATADISLTQVPPSLVCSGGGTVSADWSDSDANGELSVGDNVTLSFNNCVEEGLIQNGELEVGILSLVGDPASDPAWTVLFRLNFNSLTASDTEGIVQVVGSLDVSVDTTASGVVVTEITTEVATGPDTTASSFLYFGEGNDFTELTLYSISFQENTDGSFVLSSQGTLESSFIGGTVTFETILDLTSTAFNLDNPSAGELLIVGAANSSILLRIRDSITVELDVDDEGDGFDAGDSTYTSSWDELSAASDAL